MPPKRRNRSNAFSPDLVELQTPKTSKMDTHEETANQVSNSDLLARLEGLIIEKDTNAQKLITEMDNSAKAAMNDIRDSVAVLSDKFDESISDLKTKLDEKLTSLQKEVRINSSNISFIAHQLDRSKFCKEIYISGVPLSENECIPDIFGKICLTLGYKETNIPKVFLKRLKPRLGPSSSSSNSVQSGTSSSTSTNPPNILVEFSYQNECYDFKSRYFNSRSLNLSCLGYTNSKRIFVNERMTKYDMDIKFKALKLKRENLIHSVIVIGGRVYIKHTSDSKGVPIEDVSDLPSK